MEQDEMKLILAEILDELKKLGDKKEQEGFILDTLQAKIKQGETMPVVLDKIEMAISTIKAEFNTLPEKLLVFLKSLEALKEDVRSATLKLHEPISQKVTHHHHLKAGVILSIIFFLLLTFSIGNLYVTYQKANDYQEGAYKYKYIKLNADKNLLSYLRRIDSVFQKNRTAMINYVDQENEKLKSEGIEHRSKGDSRKIRKNLKR